MKTLIAYASKYGTTEKCAKEIADKLSGEVDLADLRKSKNIDVTGYDKVIIGGSINAGKIQAATRKFAEKNLAVLKSKTIGLFICNMEDVPEKAMAELTNNYPKELLDVAIAKNWFGGELQLAKMNPIVRFMIKKIAKTDKDMSHLQQEHIKQFILEMNKV